MIIKNNPSSMAEVKEYFSKAGEKESDILKNLKEFSKMKSEKAKDLRKSIKNLDMIKVSEKHISKIIDLMPEDIEELNKIFIDIELDEDETKKILETVKGFK